MKIHLSGKQFIFPRQCACCGTFALTYLTVSGSEKKKGRNGRTTGWSWDIPYCVQCTRHVEAFEQVSLLFLLLVSLEIMISVIVAFKSSLYTGLGLFIFSIALSLFSYFVSMRRLRKGCPFNCTQLGRSVSYLGADGSRHSFDIKSDWYAKEFLRANVRKLVNLSPEAVSMLRGMKISEHQIARRFTK